MDRKVFKSMMCLIESVYQKFELSEEVFNAWYSCLDDLTDSETFEKSVKEWIKENKFPPTVADLRELYKSNYVDDGWQRA